ncbi:MAG TPA: hypothetical protein VMF90_11375 [Rhizobiaceae bacterium]|nr:hypothetical protein [Rhizobiaceae bacterium]
MAPTRAIARKATLFSLFMAGLTLVGEPTLSADAGGGGERFIDHSYDMVRDAPDNFAGPDQAGPTETERKA